MAKQQGNRKRRLPRVLIALVVVLGVLVAADFGFRWFAEHKVSEQLHAQLHGKKQPKVNVHGFPFSTQALGGDYRNITVRASGVPATKTVRELGFHLNLRHVHAPLGKLISGELKRVPVDAVDGRVSIKDSDIARMLHLPNIRLGPASIKSVLADEQGHPDGDTEHGTRAGFRLQSSTSILGKPTKVTVFGLVSVAHGHLAAAPKRLEISNSVIDTSLPKSLTSRVLDRFVFEVDPDTLPFSVQPERVRVSKGTFSVNGRARNVVLKTDSPG